jgi:hypothetical protein
MDSWSKSDIIALATLLVTISSFLGACISKGTYHFNSVRVLDKADNLQALSIRHRRTIDMFELGA